MSDGGCSDAGANADKDDRVVLYGFSLFLRRFFLNKILHVLANFYWILYL